ncbi:MAG: TolC family protein [Proteobacteria bacterium]|nr:TolC family protein [Pseudomonadota bacterium]
MLKKLVVALSLSTALCLPSLSSAETISGTIAKALASHPQIKAGESARKQADWNISEQQSGFFPTVSLNAQDGKMRNNDKTTRGLVAGGASSWMGEGTVTITQPIFDGFSVLNRYRSAKDRYDAIRTVARNERLGYEEAHRQAEADYIEVTGGLSDTALELGDGKWWGAVPPTIEDAVSHGINGNPRILSAAKQVASSARETEATRSGLMPHLDAEMSYMKQDELEAVGGETTSAQAMLKLGWSFSTGGGEFDRLQKSREQEVEAAAKRQAVIRTVERDVRQKYTSMLVVDQQLDLLSERAVASRKILANFTAQFEGGKQTNLQLIAATSKVFEAETALTDARYRQMLSRFELLTAMGSLREAFGAAKPGASQKG